MTTLLLSHGHGLLPLANRLRREGEPVEVIPWRHRYEKAWEGTLDTALKGETRRSPEVLQSVIDLANEGGVRVLVDHPKWLDLFGNSKDLWAVTPRVESPSPLRACGWWTGETLVSPHLLVVDLGAWSGGLGPRVEGGATLIVGYQSLVGAAVAPYLDELKASSHKGLVQIHLDPQHLVGVAWEGGWQSLHTQAFQGALLSPSPKMFHGEHPTLGPRYVVVVPVSVPPWPLACDVAANEVEIPPLAPQHLDSIQWHGIKLTESQLKVAPLDGLVGVAYWGAANFPLAQRRACEAAAAVRLPEVQWRPDVGAQVPLCQAILEEKGYLP